MRLNSILIFLLLVLVPVKMFCQPGQCPDLPEKYRWITAEDYTKDRELVKKTLRWLCVTPLSEDIRVRALANAFVLEWLAGTPEITMNVRTKVLNFPDEHPELLLTFMHGMAYYALSHPKENNEVKMYEAGIKTVVDLSGQSKELSKLSRIKDFERMMKKGKLTLYLKTELK